MKTLNKKLKKAFTITELVIVIAVIAILAAVLIPTLTGIISKANGSVAMQEAKSDWTNYSVDVITDNGFTTNTYYVVHYKNETADYVFTVKDGQFNTEGDEYTTTNASTYELTGGLVGSYLETEYSTNGVAQTTCTKIYSEKAAAAAAAEAVSLTSVTDGSYYAKVVIGTTTYWFTGSVSSNSYTVSAQVEEPASTAYNSTATVDSQTVNTDYTVSLYAAS